MKRPYVVCHMCTSIDGKILSKRWGTMPGGQGAAGLFETTAASYKIPAWLVGTTTMREFMGRNAKLALGAKVPSGDFLAAPKATSFAIGTDSNAVLRFQESAVDGDHVVLLITEEAGDAYRAHLRKAGVSYFVCGKKEINLPTALQKIHAKLKLKKIMLQGGGAFNGAMLRAGLVDEISQVIVPVADGGGSEVTGLFDAPGKPPAHAVAQLRFLSQKSLPGGVRWLKYKVK